MTNEEKKKLCRGCRDDYYNRPGNSNTGECWSLTSAQLVQLTKVGVWQTPPYKWAPQQTLSCHRPQGEVWLRQDDARMTA